MLGPSTYWNPQGRPGLNMEREDTGMDSVLDIGSVALGM